MTSKWTADDMPSLTGRTAVVTGANSGLGLETSLGLARAGATVVMACRDRDKAERAAAAVRERAHGASPVVMALDLADLGSVRAFAQTFAQAYPRLDILCNNAGVMAVPYTTTRDGFEMQIGVNHMGHFALTGLLLEQLRAAPAPRVVNVASLAHRWTPGIELDDLDWRRRRYRKWQAYGDSKLANLLFTFELDRRVRESGDALAAVAAHPGYAATNLQFVGPKMEGSRLGRLAMAAANAVIAQDAVAGALPTLYAASVEDVAGGDFIGPDGWRQLRGHPTKVGARRLARDPDLSRRLWERSRELTGVEYL